MGSCLDHAWQSQEFCILFFVEPWDFETQVMIGQAFQAVTTWEDLPILLNNAKT